MKILVLAVLAMLAVVGCKNQAEHVEPNVKPGAFCGVEGNKGVTDKGTDMVCAYAKDGKLRWQAK